MSQSSIRPTIRGDNHATIKYLKKGFWGGILLGEFNSEPSPEMLKEMPLSPMLWLPLDQRGTRLKPIVGVGDSVVSGQILTATRGTDLTLIASACGEIYKIDQHIVIRTKVKDQQNKIPGNTLNEPTGYALDKRQLSDILSASGVLGFGGAAFPSGRKMSVACEHELQTLIINACECEPLISCDRALIRHNATDIVAGIQLLVDTLQPTRCIVSIEDSMSAELDLLQLSIDKIFRDTADRPLVMVVPSVFPIGSERQLIKSLLGISIPAGAKPADQGILCFNVATVHAIKLAYVDKSAPNSRIVSVTGTAIKNPCNIIARFGTPVGELASFAEPELSQVVWDEIDIVQGGAMTGRKILNQSVPITAATNCLQFNHKTNAVAATACIRCGYCNEVCPEELIVQQLLWYVQDRDIESADLFKLESCIECACCDHVCPANIPLTQVFRAGKYQKQEQFRLNLLAEQAKERTLQRDKRLEERQKLKEERIAARKKMLAGGQNRAQSKDAIQGKEAIKAALERARSRKRSP